MNTFAPKSATVLIVDSDPLTLTAVAAVLNMSGYECHCARDAEAALKAGRGLALDLILCSLDLDGEDGVALWNELRQISGLKDVPVIFISAGEIPDAVRRAHDAGATFYLRAPYDPHVLIELVDRALWMPHLVRSRLSGMHTRPARDPLARR